MAGGGVWEGLGGRGHCVNTLELILHRLEYVLGDKGHKVISTAPQLELTGAQIK